MFPSLQDGRAVGPSPLQSERYRVHRAVRALLERLATDGPLMLALDDLHWADAASVELIDHLLRHPPPQAGAARARVPAGAGIAAAAGSGRRRRAGGRRRPARPSPAGRSRCCRVGGRSSAGGRRGRALSGERRQPVLPPGADSSQVTRAWFAAGGRARCGSGRRRAGERSGRAAHRASVPQPIGRSIAEGRGDRRRPVRV